MNPSSLTLHLNKLGPALGMTVTALFVALIIVFTNYGAQALVALIFAATLIYLALRHPLTVVYFLFLTGSVSWSFVTGEEKVFFQALGGLDLNGIRLIGVVLTFSILLLYKEEGRARLLTLKLYLLFLVFAAIGLLYTWNFNSGIRLLFKFAYPYLIFCVLLMELKDRESIHKVIRVLVWGALIAFLSIPISTMFGLSTQIHPDRIELGGGGVHRSVFAFYMMCMGTFGMALYLYLREKKYLILGILSSASVVLSVTRIAVAGLLVALGIVAFRRSLVKGLIVTFVALLLAASYEPLQRRMFYEGKDITYLDLIREPHRFFTDVAASGRFPAWGAGIYLMFLKSPLVGMGTGSTTNIEYEAGNRLTVMHSEAVRILAEQGMIGTSLYVVSFGSLVYLVWRSRRALTTNLTNALCVTSYALVAAYFVVCLTDNAFDYYTMLGQNVFGIAALALRSSELDSQDPTLRSHAS